jgi:hypothetical protein
MTIALGACLGLGLSLFADETTKPADKATTKAKANKNKNNMVGNHKDTADRAKSAGTVKKAPTDQKNVSDGAAKGQATE